MLFLPGIVKQAAKVFSAGSERSVRVAGFAFRNRRSSQLHTTCAVEWCKLKHLSLCDPPVASFSSSLTLCKSGQRENLTVCCDDDDFITKQNLVRTIILQAVTLYHASVWPAADLC